MSTYNADMAEAISIRGYYQTDPVATQLSVVLGNIAASRAYVNCHPRIEYAETLEEALAIEDTKTRALVASLAKKLKVADRDQQIAFKRLGAIIDQLTGIRTAIENSSAKKETP